MRLSRQQKRPYLALLFVLLGLLLFNQTANASNYLQGDTVESSETISNDIFLTGEDIVVAGTVEGDVFAVGNNITIDGIVEGSLFTIGQNITLNGQVDGSVYAAGVTFTLGEDAEIGRSLYYVGVHLGLKQGSSIGQDLNGFMLSARLTGSVGRDIKASIGILDLIQFFLNTTDEEFEGIMVPSNPIVTIDSGETAVTTKSNATKVPANSSALTLQQQEAQADKTANPLNDQLLRLLTQYVSLLIVGSILGWLFPKQLDAWSSQVRKRPVHATGNGFIGYIVGFAATFFLIALMFAIGIGLFKLNLNELAIITWGIGFSSIGLGFSLFIALITYVSKIIVFYVVATMIFAKVIPSANNRRVWPLMLGPLLFVLIRAIPYLGWVVALIVTWMGIGAVWMAYQAQQNANATTAVSQPTEEVKE